MPSGLLPSSTAASRRRSGIDAVGVVDSHRMQVVSYIPVGWNPSAVASPPDGRMLYGDQHEGAKARGRTRARVIILNTHLCLASLSDPRQHQRCSPRQPAGRGRIRRKSVISPLTWLPSSTPTVIPPPQTLLSCDSRKPHPTTRLGDGGRRQRRRSSLAAMAWTDGRLKKHPRIASACRARFLHAPWPGLP